MIKRTLLGIVGMLSFAVLMEAGVSLAASITINPNIPGTNTGTGLAGPGALVANIYQFALLIGGILAFGAIVWGGVKYTFGAGNSSAQEEGKEWVKSAIYGLLLLIGAYLILYTINPNILKLELPGLPQVGPAVQLSGSPLGNGGGTGIPSSRCQAPASGPCSVAQLQSSCFGSAHAQIAGGVCNVESGGNPFAKSGTDKCNDGRSVSIGLFQINISANKISDPQTGQLLNCPSAFSNPFSGSNPHCTINNDALYDQCVRAAQDPTTNIAFACRLSGGGNNWAPWGPATRRACGV